MRTANTFSIQARTQHTYMWVHTNEEWAGRERGTCIPNVENEHLYVFNSIFYTRSILIWTTQPKPMLSLSLYILLLLLLKHRKIGKNQKKAQMFTQSTLTDTHTHTHINTRWCSLWQQIENHCIWKSKKWKKNWAGKQEQRHK